MYAAENQVVPWTPKTEAVPGTTVCVTTAGYSYSDWLGPVYPPGTSPTNFLALFARRFSAVELNFSYYRMPTAAAMAALCEKTPEDFGFVVKANARLTHQRERPLAWDEFASGLGPLRSRGRLAGVLFQFPYSFAYTPENRHYLADLLDAASAPDLRLLVEFRNNRWQLSRVADGLAERHAVPVQVDLPPLPGLPAPQATTPGDVGYLRLHGRNTTKWWSGTNVTRYDYRYSDSELVGIAERVDRLASTTKLVFVVFNNHFAGQAADNAGTLIESLIRDGYSPAGPGLLTRPSVSGPTDPRPTDS